MFLFSFNDLVGHNIIDVVIVLMILLFGVIGLKRGVFKELVLTVGYILVFILAFYIKNPLAEWMSLNLPFFNFWGIFKGVTVLNIFLYQMFAFIIMLTVLLIIFNIVLKIVNIFEKLLKFTIILAIPSKICGFFVGLVEGFIWVFIALYCLSLTSWNIDIVNQSKFKDKILNSTPVLSNIMSDTTDAVIKIYNLKDNFKNNKNQFNLESLKIMLDYKIVDVKYVEKLIDKDKINITGIDNLLNNYR